MSAATLVAGLRERVRERRTPAPWMVRAAASQVPGEPGLRVWRVQVYRAGAAGSPRLVKVVGYDRDQAEAIAERARARVGDPWCDPAGDLELFHPIVDGRDGG